MSLSGLCLKGTGSRSCHTAPSAVHKSRIELFSCGVTRDRKVRKEGWRGLNHISFLGFGVGSPTSRSRVWVCQHVLLRFGFAPQHLLPRGWGWLSSISFLGFGGWLLSISSYGSPASAFWVGVSETSFLLEVCSWCQSKMLRLSRFSIPGYW